MIKKFNDFILEKKLFIYTRSFRAINLVTSNIYDKETIDKWKQQYSFDDFATCIFVSEDKIKKESDIDIRLTSKDLKNKNWFNDDAGNNKGFIIDDSKIEKNGDIVYLYVFYKNSTENKRARQNHGFKYESTIKKLNGLKHLPYTDKWDAEGNLDKRFIDERLLVDGKSVKAGYSDNLYDTNYEMLSEDFKKNMHWNIKCMSIGTDIEMGDFLRISGYKKVGDRLKKRNIRNEKCFMYNVSFHDNNPSDRKILEEYFILMPMHIWATYLPNIDANIKEFESMYRDLKTHKLIGARTDETEENWKKFRNRYEVLFKDSPIKIRFKRDSKGQLRIQSAISYNNFKNLVLKNLHIKIS